MARVAIATVLVSSLLGADAFIDAAPAEAKLRPCTFKDTIAGNRRTIGCFAWHMNMNRGQALKIAGAESGFNERAWNSSSGAAGLFQHLIRYWNGRVAMARPMLRRFDVRHPAWFNPRAQAVVTYVYVRRYGWCPAWTTAAC